MTVHSECDIISCHMFPQINNQLPLCSSYMVETSLEISLYKLLLLLVTNGKNV